MSKTRKISQDKPYVLRPYEDQSERIEQFITDENRRLAIEGSRTLTPTDHVRFIIDQGLESIGLKLEESTPTPEH
tara:strand:- start:9374 stop:9598 length:225 start_codon:yes stop_codon:yes gene_type:complete